jgi:SRSO17 transposase
MVEGMGRTERREALGAYVTGLLLDGERKSIEQMAARLVDDASEIQAVSSTTIASMPGRSVPSLRASRAHISSSAQLATTTACCRSRCTSHRSGG